MKYYATEDGVEIARFRSDIDAGIFIRAMRDLYEGAWNAAAFAVFNDDGDRLEER